MRYRRILFAIIPTVHKSPEEAAEYVEKFKKLLSYLKMRAEDEVSERSERALRKTRATTKLTLFQLTYVRFAHSPPPCSIKNAPRFARSVQNEIFVEFVDVDDQNPSTKNKNDTKANMKTYVVPLANLSKNGRYEWMILAMSSFFDPRRVFRIGYCWLVGSASRVESEVKGLSRRCAQYGLALQQMPEYSLSSNLHIHPFVAPVLLVVNSADIGDLIEQNLFDKFDFVDDGYRHTDYLGVPGLSEFR